MTKPVTYLIAAVVGLSVLTAAGPTLVALLHAAVPLVIAVGGVVVVVRLMAHFTDRY
jgi:hypothetical protein